MHTDHMQGHIGGFALCMGTEHAVVGGHDFGASAMMTSSTYSRLFG